MFLQFTGLKDKNGKEMYEGDLLEVAGRLVYEVVFMAADENGESCAAFGIKRIDKPEEQFAIDSYAIKNGEVIGNIYENPDLVKA